ncbi:MAG: protein translocase subunit SecD, partial [Actinomycetota bacterium]|nr:protein translocase subunit SecD [Actinomycetota bacterium]
MAAPSTTSRPGRALAAMLALGIVIFGLIPVIAPKALGKERLSLAEKFAPRLGLDLEGGTQIILQPRPAEGGSGKITEENITRAVEIIQQRVNAFGVAESEVAAQGAGDQQSIVISIPGERNEEILDRVRQTAELRFRQVLTAAPGAPLPEPTATPAETPKPKGKART